MKRSKVLISATSAAPLKEVSHIAPQVDCDFKRCEVTLNIGLFFDGTNNNKYRDSATHADSNISRLYEAYNDDRFTGYAKFYIPGVGTKFTEVGEYEDSKINAGCSFGCESRVIFGLLAVLNSLYRRSYRTELFDENTVRALCRNSVNVSDSDDLKHLSNFGIHNGLLQPNLGNNRNRLEFLTRQASYLEAQLRVKKPRVVECFVDVFGFSRGAAEARVFCHWLDELLLNGRLAGVPLQLRFVGIMDTVASAGFWSGASALASNSTGGHGAWANAESLRIPASVHNCVHMIAMHELRRNFPLDEIGVNGHLQQGWSQYAYPGAHSDVGGGYRPGELGTSVGDDSLKLSQIPLKHMLDCAIKAGAPLTRPRTRKGEYNAFSIHSDLMKVYDGFISEATLAPRPIYEWLQLYLNWRWQVREQFHITNQVKKAEKTDKDVLIKYNNSLINDAAAISQSSTQSFSQRTFSVLKDALYTGARRDLLRTSLLDPEAKEVLALAKRSKSTPASFVALFDGYVHDSLAGFDSVLTELTGYWRYRKVFLGSDEYAIAENQYTDTTSKLA